MNLLRDKKFNLIGMRLLNTFFKNGPKEGCGRTTFIASLFFAMFSTGWLHVSELECI